MEGSCRCTHLLMERGLGRASSQHLPPSCPPVCRRSGFQHWRTGLWRRDAGTRRTQAAQWRSGPSTCGQSTDSISPRKAGCSQQGNKGRTRGTPRMGHWEAPRPSARRRGPEREETVQGHTGGSHDPRPGLSGLGPSVCPKPARPLLCRVSHCTGTIAFSLEGRP